MRSLSLFGEHLFGLGLGQVTILWVLGDPSGMLVKGSFGFTIWDPRVSTVSASGAVEEPLQERGLLLRIFW